MGLKPHINREIILRIILYLIIFITLFSGCIRDKILYDAHHNFTIIPMVDSRYINRDKTKEGVCLDFARLCKRKLVKSGISEDRIVIRYCITEINTPHAVAELDEKYIFDIRSRYIEKKKNINYKWMHIIKDNEYRERR